MPKNDLFSLSVNGYGIKKTTSNQKQIDELKKQLTVSPLNDMSSSFLPENCIEKVEQTLYKENDSKIYIPRSLGLSKFGEPSKNSISEGEARPNMIFQGSLRPEQEEPTSLFLKACQNPLQRGGIISVPCAGGKTVMAIYCACKLKVKTLFIHHKDFLGNQFRERATMFCPNSKIGKIKQKTIDIEDKDFVVASLQSLAMRDYPGDIFNSFGLVIIDECHHTSAEVFSRALMKLGSIKYTMGLSATLDRKDGLRCVFEWFLGEPVYIPNARNKDSEMTVKLHTYYNASTDYSKTLKLWNGVLNHTGMITSICSFKPRTEYICSILLNILKKESLRKVLILSERKNLLKYMEKLILFNGPLKLKKDLSIGYYTGGMAREDLKESEGKQIILATFQMASEGMDIPGLNTLIMASPITSIEQSLGRIQRQTKQERTYTPLTIDIIDDFGPFKWKSKKRIDYYKSCNFNIIGLPKPRAVDIINPSTAQFLNDDDSD
jgi:superfamily II DNA or RNA helicase